MGQEQSIIQITQKTAMKKNSWLGSQCFWTYCIGGVNSQVKAPALYKIISCANWSGHQRTRAGALWLLWSSIHSYLLLFTATGELGPGDLYHKAEPSGFQ
jgi:hypothetical protein